MKSLKNFIELNNKLNKTRNRNNNIHKKKFPKREFTICDKVSNYFKSYDFEKLRLFGEDDNNFGNFIYLGKIYKPKNIKVEYFGDKKIKNNLIIKKMK